MFRVLPEDSNGNYDNYSILIDCLNPCFQNFTYTGVDSPIKEFLFHDINKGNIGISLNGKCKCHIGPDVDFIIEFLITLTVERNHKP